MNSSKGLIRVALLFAICMISMLVVVSADSGLITGNGVNFRTGPGTDYSVIEVLPKGTIVTTTGAEGNWVKASYNGKDGYICGTYINVRKSVDTDRSGVLVQREVQRPKGEEVVEYARQFIGTRYVYGGSSPDGFDCSGFTSYVYEHFGYSLNRTAAGQNSNGIWISKDDLIAGDLVLFSNGGSGIGHVGIYIGNGEFINAARPGVALKYDNLNSGYYAKNYVSARRIIY